MSSPSTLSTSTTGNPPPVETKEQHSLTLKVMRLCKPSFHSSLLAQSPIESLDIGQIATSSEFGITDLLTLPHNFGNIYLGETFTSYISVHNHTPFDVKSVTVKAELQTATQRFNLLDISASPILVFGSGENHDYVVNHEIKEGGVHILVCAVNYVKHDGEKKNFRKFFRFQVMNPIAIKTLTNDLQQGVFLVAQIKNAGQSPLFLETVKFEPVPLFNAIDLNQPNNSLSDITSSPSVVRSSSINTVLVIPNDLAYMKPGDIRQYLFRLEAKTINDPRVKTSTTLGKMDIVWKSNLGETGRLQTGPLERKLANQLDIEIIIRKIPAHIALETPFSVLCDIINRCDRPLQPRLLFLKNLMNGILPNGISGLAVEKLEPGATATVNLSLFPIKPGVHKITGLRIVDELTQKNYDFTDVIDVFVET